jgi:hypothetical protein
MSLDVKGDQSSSDRTASRPMNGDEYIESLRDRRQIYIHGQRVEDVTTHPAFRNSVRSIARLYNALHDPATKDELTTETETAFRLEFPKSRDFFGADTADIRAIDYALQEQGVWTAD